MSSYENAPATGLLATNCCACGRPLVDSISVSLGIGPDCRSGYSGNITPEQQENANQLTFKAAIAAHQGNVVLVRSLAEQIRQLGLDVLAEKIEDRFVFAERQAKINIQINGDYFTVKTPFRRGDKDGFIFAWRAIPGRRYSNGANMVPVNQKELLWNLLRKYFPNQYGMGPKGVFRITPLDDNQ